jgi:glycerophosphoryl diester phosphodiesterase
MPATSARLERIAHRGAPRERVENTLPGFLLALDHGADAIELDVHVTRDARVVVHHDARVSAFVIAETPWSTLQTVELRDGARIPRLEDVLDSVGDSATVYIEMKGASGVETVVAVARAHGQRFAIHSFDHDCIARIARIASDIPRGILLDRGTPDPIAPMRGAARDTEARDVWPHWTLVAEDFVAAAREIGVRVLPWTVNDAADAARLAALGVDGVCTDDVRLLATV